MTSDTRWPWGMPLLQHPQQVDELLTIDVVSGQSQVEVFLVIWAIRPQDVQPLATATHAHQQPLSHQQPAGKHQGKAPDGVAGVHEIPPGVSCLLAAGIGLLPLVLLDERLLLVWVGLPQETSHLVVTDANPFQHVLDAAGRIADAEGLLNPVADLVGVAEAAPGDLVFELLDLVRVEVAGVALVQEGAEGFEPVVSEDTEPLAQLGEADAQKLGDLLAGFARGDGQDGGEALVDTPVKGLLAAAFDLLALLIAQHYRFHGRLPGLSIGRSRVATCTKVAYCTRRFSIGDGIEPPP